MVAVQLTCREKSNSTAGIGGRKSNNLKLEVFQRPEEGKNTPISPLGQSQSVLVPISTSHGKSNEEGCGAVDEGRLFIR